MNRLAERPIPPLPALPGVFALTFSEQLHMSVWRGHSCPRKVSAREALAGRSKSFPSLAVMPLLAILSIPSLAQRHSSPALRSFGPRAQAHRSARPLRSAYNPLAALPFPFFGDAFNPDDLPSGPDPNSADASAAQSPAFLMQALQSLTGSATGPLGLSMGASKHREPAQSEPLMIELQNGRYVRVKSDAVNGEAQPLALAAAMISKPKKSAHAARAISPAPAPASPSLAAAPLPAAVLIFRDGHSEEVRDYTIANNTLYASGDYYADGHWNKKIDLATLNVPSTLEANATRKVNFVLPHSPNEVITRF